MNRPLAIYLAIVSLWSFGGWIAPTCAQETAALLEARVWTEHVRNDLAPFWMQDSALGSPVGAFPTARCNNGTLVSSNSPCPEIGRHPGMLERSVVALSRQSYGYGVAFHLSGDRRYLDLMRSGIEFIRKNAVDRVNGGIAITQNLRGGWGPAVELRSPQEIGYGLLGMGLYYYLTRDEDVLTDIISVKNFIFEKYRSPGGGVRWDHMSSPTRQPKTLLTAQLDQMNTYLVLLTPLLPASLQKEWSADLVRLSQSMIDDFYVPSEKLFVLNPDPSLEQALSRDGTDFGHTAKALWMIRWAGRITNRPDLVSFAEAAAAPLLKRAFLEDCGCWSGGLKPGGAPLLEKSWWVYAELDQLAGSLALQNRNLSRVLSRTYDYWFKNFVDKEYGEVWSMVDGNTHTPVRTMPKQWAWKNAYHSFEHALVSYIVTQQIHGSHLTLFYAFSKDVPRTGIQPYFFSARIMGAETLKDETGHSIQKVVFADVK